MFKIEVVSPEVVYRLRKVSSTLILGHRVGDEKGGSLNLQKYKISFSACRETNFPHFRAFPRKSLFVFLITSFQMFFHSFQSFSEQQKLFV